MKALCGAASPCRGATTVRQLQTRGEWWEAAGCVDHTERVQLQWHCEGVDQNSAALACEGVDENARAWTKTRGNPDSCIGACQQRIDAVCRAGSASAVPSAQPPKSECEHASWLLASKTRSLQTFLAISLASSAAPSKLLTVWIAQSSCRASAGCGLHCWTCLGLDCHDFRMPMQLHALIYPPNFSEDSKDSKGFRTIETFFGWYKKSFNSTKQVHSWCATSGTQYKF